MSMIAIDEDHYLSKVVYVPGDYSYAKDHVGTGYFVGCGPPPGRRYEYKYAVYRNVTPANNDGSTIYTLAVGRFPIGGFWSIRVTTRTGRFRKNPINAYTLKPSPRTKSPTDG